MNKVPFFVILPVMGIIAILNIFIPRQVWRVTAKLQYKNPDAVEPSDFAFTMQRIVSVVVLGFVVYIFVTQIAK